MTASIILRIMGVTRAPLVIARIRMNVHIRDLPLFILLTRNTLVRVVGVSKFVIVVLNDVVLLDVLLALRRWSWVKRLVNLSGRGGQGVGNVLVLRKLLIVCLLLWMLLVVWNLRMLYGLVILFWMMIVLMNVMLMW
uniref:Transmembrane protein n=1 Tax=Cacopsylla melanoneura TaxID=428564 RepID=A0A8D8ZA37_9HEMI